MAEVISKVLPIILLTMTGLFIRRLKFIEEKALGEIRKLILNVCLPSTLFLIFLNIELKREYLTLIIYMIVLFFLLYIAGGILGKAFNHKSGMSQFFSTGFSFGLVGIPLFSIMFGEENMGLYSVMGLSHEIFVWFIYYPILSLKLGRGKGRRISSILKSPLNLAIFSGVLLNLTGLGDLFYTNYILMGLTETLRYLGGINAPLILICIGYGINFDRSCMAESIRLSAVRILTTFSVGYAFKILVLDRIGGIDGEVFAYSFFTLIVLPPLLSLPLFLSRYGRVREEQVINNATVQCTILSMIFFIGYNIFKGM